MQLTAAAERKAAMVSNNLLNGIQRTMQDGKSKVGFPMFLTVMIVLNCVEKTTWAFKAWEQENLRPKWPLEKAPSEYTIQGHGLCDLLRLLLTIRHILPKTTATTFHSPITTTSEDPVTQKYFKDLNVSSEYIFIIAPLHVVLVFMNLPALSYKVYNFGQSANQYNSIFP